jgi:outer membrane biosynthesis protein TonB
MQRPAATAEEIMQGRNTKGFDDFRWERKRSQTKRPPQPGALGFPANEALKELEKVEAKEVLDQQLTREVHDFFAAATRQAAGIVERVAKDAEAEAGQRVEQEMEAFLFDALSRMNAFVATVLQHKRGPVAETDLEPRIANIVGAALDRFRNEGTAELYDKHIGQDPFNTAVDEVQRELRAASTAPENVEPEPVPIEEHKVAALQPEAEQDEQPPEEEPPAYPYAPPAAAHQPAAKPSTPPVPAKPPQPAPQAAAPRAPEPAAAETPTPSQANPAQEQELERFKGTLKALVRQGVMNKEEARAAWQSRLATMGLKA